MIKAFLSCILLVLLISQTNAEESLSNQYNKMINENFESVTKGMTSEMKERYKAQMELAIKEMAKYDNLSQEEKNKIDEENKKNLNDPKKIEQIKKNLGNMPNEDKAILNIMANNLNNEIRAIKNPPLENNKPKSDLKLKKLDIRAGTPNLLIFPDEKLTGLGNADAKVLKAKYSELKSKMNQINTIEVNNYCASELDCMSMSYGQQLNGGPAGFIIMSKNDVNSKAIMARINDFTEMDKNIQSTLKGFLQSGKQLEWPDLECIQNKCREK